MAKQESDNRQFEPNLGMPYFHGTPLGWGLMGLDNPLPPDIEPLVWNWEENMAVSKGILDDKWNEPTSGVQAFWNAQVQQWQDYNMNNPLSPVSEHPNIIISDIEFSHNPTGAQKPFTDGMWMKQYNGAGTAIVNGVLVGGNWMAWKNDDPDPLVTPYWKYNPTNPSGDDYVTDVVSEGPL